MRSPQQIRRVAVVGTGALGASWVSLLLPMGYEVVAVDPGEGAEQRLLDTVRAQAGPDADLSRLTFTADLDDGARGADLVIEAEPERLDVKQDIVRRIDAVVDADVVVASSTSGLLPSTFAGAAERHPERVLVAHPFNPPHLMPLVEIVGGEQTSEEAADAAMAIFAHLGKTPIRIRKELPGHVANRLQAALWREAYHLVGTGAISAADLDTAIASGPGLRWALLGPFATQHLSGGPGGFAHICEHLGPPTEKWWADLGTPSLTPELVGTLVASVDEEFAGADVADVAARRDAALRELIALKADRGLAEGVGGIPVEAVDAASDSDPRA